MENLQLDEGTPFHHGSWASSPTCEEGGITGYVMLVIGNAEGDQVAAACKALQRRGHVKGVAVGLEKLQLAGIQRRHLQSTRQVIP